MIERLVAVPLGGGLARMSRSCSLYKRSIAQFRRAIRQSSNKSEHLPLPRLAQPSIWNSIIPKFLRNREPKPAMTERKPLNPATYFIWIYLLIGSQAIRIIQVQNEYTTFVRKADLKIAKLREVVEKLQRGEEVDVEKTLGTGDETQEKEWEEALREIEAEDRVWQTRRQRYRENQRRREEEKREASPVNEGEEKAEGEPVPSRDEQPTQAQPGFY